MQTQRAKGVDSARRVLQIFLSFNESNPEITVDEVAKQFEISIPSAYRYISLLRELYLIEDSGRGGFTLTPQIFRLVSVAESSLDVGNVGKPVVNRLARQTNETALIFRRVGESALCVASSTPDMMAKISFKPGYLMPLRRGAGPKLLLAMTSQEWREKYLRRIQESMDLSAAEIAQLESDLAQIRKQQYAISDSEVDEGVYAVSAPIVVEGRVVAALSLAGLSFRLDDEKKANLLREVELGAREVADLIPTSASDV